VENAIEIVENWGELDVFHTAEILVNTIRGASFGFAL
jgi:hypothetical protein